VRAATESVDFEQSTAYMRSRTELGVRINLEGREPSGVVPPEEYDTVREELIDELAAAETPDGEPVFDEVVPREAYFEGPYAEDAADVIVVPREFNYHMSSLLSGETFGPIPQPWNHKRDGLVAARGAGVDATASLDGAHLFDVAPTVLSTLDVPPSDTMDGEPLGIVDSRESDEYAAFDASDTTETADEGVERRLAALGYLDDNEH